MNLFELECSSLASTSTPAFSAVSPLSANFLVRICTLSQSGPALSNFPGNCNLQSSHLPTTKHSAELSCTVKPEGCIFLVFVGNSNAMGIIVIDNSKCCWRIYEYNFVTASCCCNIHTNSTLCLSGTYYRTTKLRFGDSPVLSLYNLYIN